MQNTSGTTSASAPDMKLFYACIIVSLIIFQLGAVFGWSTTLNVVLILLITALFGWYTRSLGQPLFIILLLIMIPLATTELGTDSWITNLITPAMNDLGIQAGWVLVYTSAIMFVLRFFAGPIVHKVSPLGLLAICSAIAAVTTICEEAKKEALRDIIIFPIIMLVSYLGLILYFRSKGGYKAVLLDRSAAKEPTYQSVNS